MRTTQSLARLWDFLLQQGQEFSAIFNCFQQKGEQWYFFTAHFSQGVRPGADQGSIIFWFEQMELRVAASLGTQIPSHCSILCGEAFQPSLLTGNAESIFILIKKSFFCLNLKPPPPLHSFIGRGVGWGKEKGRERRREFQRTTLAHAMLDKTWYLMLLCSKHQRLCCLLDCTALTS